MCMPPELDEIQNADGLCDVRRLAPLKVRDTKLYLRPNLYSQRSPPPPPPYFRVEKGKNMLVVDTCAKPRESNSLIWRPYLSPHLLTSSGPSTPRSHFLPPLSPGRLFMNDIENSTLSMAWTFGAMRTAAGLFVPVTFQD